MIAAPPASWAGPSGSANSTVPAIAPTSGSRLTNAPATSARTRLWPKANSAVGATVPASTSAPVASSAAELAWSAGLPSVSNAIGSVSAAAASNCTALTATGSRSRSIRAWDTTKAADTSCAASTRPSPYSEEPPPLPAATIATPPSDSAKPAQAMGRAMPCPEIAAIIATSAGIVPISRAACVTLVCCTPMFCNTTEAP